MDLDKRNSQTMNSFRLEIDTIDRDIVSLLINRFSTVKCVGDYKRENGIDIKDIKRENEILSDRIKDIEDPVIKREIEKIFRVILDSSCEIQGN